MDGNQPVVPVRAALDVSVFEPPWSLKGAIGAALYKLGTRPWVLRLLRSICPLFPGPFTVVFRFDDAVEVLSNDRVFGVTGERIIKSNGGEKAKGGGGNFLLGMPDDGNCPHHASVEPPDPNGCPYRASIAAKDRGYRAYQAQVQRLFRFEDVASLVIPIVQRHVAQVLPSGTKRIDVVQQLLTGVPIELCRRYYGVQIPDAEEFSHWTFALSRWLFDPVDPSRYEALALEASARLDALIDVSIQNAKAARNVSASDTILRRLLADGVDDVTTRVILSGMMLGFVPTNTMAGEHILKQLLDNQEMMLAARAAARAGHADELLTRCLFEAFRFDPLDREPLRVCTQDYTLGAGKWYQRKLRKGDKVIVVTRSALMDSSGFSDPRKFDPSRSRANDMLFGYGLHRCIGVLIAEAQITYTFKHLLKFSKIERAPKPEAARALGPFATHLELLLED